MGKEEQGENFCVTRSLIMISSEDELLYQFPTLYITIFFCLFIPKGKTCSKISLCCVKMTTVRLSVRTVRADAIQELLTAPERLRCFF